MFVTQALNDMGARHWSHIADWDVAQGRKLPVASNEKYLECTVHGHAVPSSIPDQYYLYSILCVDVCSMYSRDAVENSYSYT